VYGIACWGRLRAKALRQLAVVAASFVAGGALVYAATGFSLRECFAVARFQNVALMTRVIGRDPAALYGRIAFGNLAAFAIGAGLGLVSALALRLRASGSKLDPWTAATAATLAVMTFGGFYTMETERIWLYALPGSRSSRFRRDRSSAPPSRPSGRGLGAEPGDGGSSLYALVIHGKQSTDEVRRRCRAPGRRGDPFLLQRPLPS